MPARRRPAAAARPPRWPSPGPSWPPTGAAGAGPGRRPRSWHRSRQLRCSAPDGRITARQMEAAVRRGDAGARRRRPGRLLARLPWGSYGMLARASLTSPDLGVALKRWCRHHGLLTDDIRLALVERGHSAGHRDRRTRRPGRGARIHAWSTCCATSTAWPAGTSIRASRCRARGFRFRRRRMRDAYPIHVPRPACTFGARARRDPLRRALPGAAAAARREGAAPDAAARPAAHRAAVPARPPAGAAGAPGAGRASRAGAQRRRPRRAAARVGAHAAPPAQGRRRQPAAAEGRGAARARQRPALAHRPAAQAGGRGLRLSQREELHPRVPAVDGRHSGGVSKRASARWAALRLRPSASLRMHDANERTAGGCGVSRFQSMPGERTGVGLSSGIARTSSRGCTAWRETMAASWVRATSPIIGAIVFISAATTGSAPQARKHSSSIVRVANCDGSSTRLWRCSSTMRTRLRCASGMAWRHQQHHLLGVERLEPQTRAVGGLIGDADIERRVDQPLRDRHRPRARPPSPSRSGCAAGTMARHSGTKPMLKVPWRRPAPRPRAGRPRASGARAPGRPRAAP